MIYKESEIQKNIVKGFKYLFPKSMIFSIPNEGKRNIRTAAIMKSTGMMHGTSDLIVIHKSKIYFIEVKSEKGKQSEHQKEFEIRVKAHGFDYYIITKLEELINILNEKIK